jgi:tRNA (adenine37-N6)-methyltransferase
LEPVTFSPIGVIRSPFTEVAGMPIQTTGARGIAGSIEILPEYAAGLRDIDGFSHLILIYHLHRIRGFQLEVTPFLDTKTHGIFAVRSPRRPNAIGLSIVRLIEVEGNVLRIEDIDILDGTPLLDLKPYVPAFDAHATDRTGWFAGRAENAEVVRSDSRFA